MKEQVQEEFTAAMTYFAMVNNFKLIIITIIPITNGYQLYMKVPI